MIPDLGSVHPEEHHQRFMRRALAEAGRARDAGEVPVGAVVVIDREIVASAHNCPVSSGDPTAHAEIIALRRAAARVGNYRLSAAELYVTLEPCPMCAGALVHARIAHLIFGARDIRFGGVRSKFRIADSELLNHRVQITEGVLAFDCASLLRNFFQTRR